jgi:hypothetical protein
MILLIKINWDCIYSLKVGRAIAQVVSRWFPSASILVRARSGELEFVIDKVTMEQVFSEYFGFPCQSSFHQIIHPHIHPGQIL